MTDQSRIEQAVAWRTAADTQIVEAATQLEALYEAMPLSLERVQLGNALVALWRAVATCRTSIEEGRRLSQ